MYKQQSNFSVFVTTFSVYTDSQVQPGFGPGTISYVCRVELGGLSGSFKSQAYRCRHTDL